MKDVGNNMLIGDDRTNILIGHEGHDTLTGNGGDDVLLGSAGNDTLDGGDDDDQLFGGLGENLVYFPVAMAGVVDALLRNRFASTVASQPWIMNFLSNAENPNGSPSPNDDLVVVLKE